MAITASCVGNEIVAADGVWRACEPIEQVNRVDCDSPAQTPSAGAYDPPRRYPCRDHRQHEAAPLKFAAVSWQPLRPRGGGLAGNANHPGTLIRRGRTHSSRADFGSL